MKKEIIRVEPLATYLERWKAPTSTVVKHGNTLYVTGAPPYEPETGEIFGGDIRRQAELVLEQLKACVEAGGSSLENVLQLTVYSTSQEYFAPINEVYVKYFPTNWPARMFLCVQPFAGRFDVEMTCIAAIYGAFMFSVIFEVLPRKENWDDNLENAKMLRPELEQVDGFPAVSD